MWYCDWCEEWVEPEDRKCPICGKVLKERKPNKKEFNDDLEPEDLEWMN